MSAAGPDRVGSGGKGGERLPGLDGLRALAALGVVAVHSTGLPGFPRDQWLHTVGKIWGSLGVPLFFVLSGYLITLLMLREEGAFGSISLRHFYARRALRILPASLFYLGVLSVLTPLAGLTVRPIEVAASVLWFRNLLYNGWAAWALKLGDGVHYTGHFWSLSVEEHFYFFWPLVFLVAGARRRMWILTVLLLVLPVWRTLNLRWHSVGGMNYWRTDLIADYLMGGALLAVLQVRFGGTRAWARFWKVGLPGFGALGAAIVCARNFGPGSGPVWRVLVMADVPATMLGLVAVVGWGARGGDSLGHRFLNSPVMVWLGTISYGLYLWQQLFSGSQLPAIWQSFPLNLVWSLAAASFSYYVIERPFLRMRARFRRHTAGPMVRSSGH